MSQAIVANTAAATDVEEFIASLDGGQFERMLSVALSQVSAAVVDHNKAGEVTVKFSFKKIAQTQQVHISHTLKYTKPTEAGKTSEDAERSTPMHVGRFGALSLTAPNQTDMFKTPAPTANA